ncbi:DNA-protecting protein DprA [bacterium]|nr:DNA-protecting protein DprA [bacterium]
MDDDCEYPEILKRYLGNSHPEILFYMGEKAILRQPMIMISGSREASVTGLEIAHACGKLITARGYAVASGYARGVDRAAHLGALEAGGNTLAALPYGFSRFRLHHTLAEAFDPERFLVMSEVPPGIGFSVMSAFRRNKYLAALAEAVIVIEPGEKGGTWFSAERASRMKKPLFYFEGDRPYVIERMIPLGGIRLTVKNGIPDIEPVFEQCRR